MMADLSDRLARLQTADMSPHVGARFSLSGANCEDFEAILDEVRDESRADVRHGPSGIRPPFSLYFLCCDAVARPQGTYEVATDGFEALSIFLTPILSPGEPGLMQALFH